jgi:aldehyde dehydrogenase (NAD+)
MEPMNSPSESLPTAGDEALDLLSQMGLETPAGGQLSPSPIDGTLLPRPADHSLDDVDLAIARSASAFAAWREVPAPTRGLVVRDLGRALEQHREALGRLVSIEVGKSLSEGIGEVQEMIDICDFAVGLSRQLHGLTIVSERPKHHMRETWQPLGPVGVISAFNFPVAVWSWNAALALVCGDSVLWKPSEKTPLTAYAVQGLFDRVIAANPNAPEGLSQLLIGGRLVGEQLAQDDRVPLISATGSTAMGRSVALSCAGRFARSLLELGGNAATIVTPSADLQLAVRAIAFGATGTTGQRCTTMRRLIVHESIYDQLVPRLEDVFQRLPIGDPRDASNLVGPLIDLKAVEAMARALERARADGGQVVGGEPVGGCYVRPALVKMPTQTPLVREETFAPILFVLRYSRFEEAIALLREVPQGLSSSILTTDVRESEAFLSATGSDCGIANVNMGTSGAEIGGAFGGEKETGGGRESGSDSWRAYMRRQTQTVNYGYDLPLAQGVSFHV